MRNSEKKKQQKKKDREKLVKKQIIERRLKTNAKIKEEIKAENEKLALENPPVKKIPIRNLSYNRPEIVAEKLKRSALMLQAIEEDRLKEEKDQKI